MSSTYRDDREAIRASIDALRRENDDLRAENLALRALVDPAPARASLAQLQGAFAATLVIVGALVGAAALARESHAVAAPTRPSEREFPVAVIPLPPAPTPRVEVRDEPRDEPDAAGALATPDVEVPQSPSPFAARAALRPVEGALARCLPRGDYRLRVRLDESGAPASRDLSARRGPAPSAEALRCADAALAALRSDAARELRYSLRVDATGLRVRRARAR